MPKPAVELDYSLKAGDLAVLNDVIVLIVSIDYGVQRRSRQQVRKVIQTIQYRINGVLLRAAPHELRRPTPLEILARAAQPDPPG